MTDSETNTPVERCGHPTEDGGECSRHGTYPDGRCYQHTDHANLLEESAGDTVSYAKCATCGKRFSTPADLRDHREEHHPKRERAKQVARAATERTKRGGSKAKAGSKKGLVYLFDERGEVLSLGIGVYLGNMWGHAPGQALTLLTVLVAGGAGAAELTRKLPGVDADRVTEVVTRNLVQFVIGLVLGGVYIVLMHGSLDSPVYIPPIEDLPDYLWHLFGGHTH